MLDELCEQLGELVGVDEAKRVIWFADGEVRESFMAGDVPAPLSCWNPVYDPKEVSALRIAGRYQARTIDMWGMELVLPTGALGWGLYELHFIVSPRSWIRLLSEIRQPDAVEGEWLTLGEVASLLKWSERTITRILAETPELPGRPVSAPGQKRSGFRWHREDLRCFLEAYRARRDESAVIGKSTTERKKRPRKRKTRSRAPASSPRLTDLAKQLSSD